MKHSRDRNNDICNVRIVHQDKVAKARSQALSAGDTIRLASLFKALGDQGRLMILMALTQGEMCVCDIAAFLAVSESAVSHQLRKLRDLNLVKNRREGQVLYYSIDDIHVGKLIKIGVHHLSR